MHVRAKLFVAFACAAAVVAVVAPTASSAKTECNGFYANTTLSGGVVVNPGDTCSLDHVTVTGGLTVNGDSTDAALSVENSNISGGWTMTGNVFPFNNNNFSNNYFCGNNVTGGLIVHDVFSFGEPLSFGEVNAGCAGGTISHGVKLINNDSAGVEIDAYKVTGGLTITGNTGFNEVEGSNVSGGATCQAGTANDGEGPNTYSGGNHGCPA